MSGGRIGDHRCPPRGVCTVVSGSDEVQFERETSWQRRLHHGSFSAAPSLRALFAGAAKRDKRFLLSAHPASPPRSRGNFRTSRPVAAAENKPSLLSPVRVLQETVLFTSETDVEERQPRALALSRFPLPFSRVQIGNPSLLRFNHFLTNWKIASAEYDYSVKKALLCRRNSLRSFPGVIQLWRRRGSSSCKPMSFAGRRAGGGNGISLTLPGTSPRKEEG